MVYNQRQESYAKAKEAIWERTNTTSRLLKGMR
jgi:hypothetical protein